MAERAATCAGCGCGCDDIEVTVGAEALERVIGTCSRGDAWFAVRTADAPPPARVDGREVDLAEALDAAAAILGEARLPLVCGLTTTDCESQRAAVALADTIGAVLDPVGPTDAGAAAAAAQAFGLSTATFGDVRDRAEVAVAWRADPVTTNPRLLPRLRLGGARLVVIDAERTATADEAAAFIAVPPERDFEALWALRALVRDLPLDRDAAAGLPLDALAELADRLRGCSYGALLYGAGLAGTTDGYANALGLFALVRDLASTAHVVALPVRADGNARGAEDVLASQTGYPSAVSFAHGHPRARPGEFSAAGVLERGDADAALIVGFDALAHLPPRAADHVRSIPTVVVDPRATETAAAARVAFATTSSGVEHEGTIHRMDGVPVPLRAPLTSTRPGDREVLAALATRVATGEGA